MMVCFIAFQNAFPANAQLPLTQNLTFNPNDTGHYFGYSMDRFSFVGGSTGVGIDDGYVMAGSIYNWVKGTHDSVNLVVRAELNNVIKSYNFGIPDAEDLRVVSVINMGYDSFYLCNCYAITLQVRGGGRKDRIALAVFSDWAFNVDPVMQFLTELELPANNVYPTGTEYDHFLKRFYFTGFATDAAVAGYPYEPQLSDSKFAFLGRFNWFDESGPLDYTLYDSPIPPNPPPGGVIWNGQYNDYDAFQRIRGKANSQVFLLTGSCNGTTNTSWNGNAWPVNTSCAVMYNLDTTNGLYRNDPVLGSNGDSWTLPEILPNRLPSDPSGLQAVEATIDASGTQGFWVVANRLDTTQWHITHIDNSAMTGVNLSVASPGWFNTYRDSLCRQITVHGAQRFEYPLTSSNNTFSIYGKYGLFPFQITLNPGFTTPYYYFPNWYSYSGVFNTFGKFIIHPTLHSDLNLIVTHPNYWMKSDCAQFNIPNSGCRYGTTGSNANYFAQVSSVNFSFNNISPRYIQGDEYGDFIPGSVTPDCPQAYQDITATDLLFGRVNVVQAGGLIAIDGGKMEYVYEEPVALRGLNNEVITCLINSDINYRMIQNQATEVDIQVMPNPANNFVDINWGDGVNSSTDHLTIQLIDLLGRKQSIFVNNMFIRSTTTRIDLSSQAPGIYQLSLFKNGRLQKTTKLSIVK